MFLSHPESDLTNNIAVLGADIMEILKKKDGYVIVELLLAEFSKKNKQASVELFFDSLTFLFLVNVIESNGYKIKLRI